MSILNSIKNNLAKLNEVPKIPPLVKPPNRGNRLPDIIAKAKEMVGPKDKKKIDSDDDRSSVGSVNGKTSNLIHEISRRSVQKSNYFF